MTIKFNSAWSMEDSGIDSGERVANFMVIVARKIIFFKIFSSCMVSFVVTNEIYAKFAHSNSHFVSLSTTQQNYNNNVESENSSNEDILNVNSRSLNVTSNRDSIDDLAFRNPSLLNPIQTSVIDGSLSSQVPIEQQKKSHHLNEHNRNLSNIRGLQRKLEQKVERAKKNFQQSEKFNQSDDDFVSFHRGRKNNNNCVDIHLYWFSFHGANH